jgi:hypothetical protein
MTESISSSSSEVHPEWLRLVQKKVESLRYGVVNLVVHDGRVTQIEHTEKTRLAANSRNAIDD